MNQRQLQKLIKQQELFREEISGFQNLAEVAHLYMEVKTGREMDLFDELPNDVFEALHKASDYLESLVAKGEKGAE